jgi:hypothetical protein
LDDAEARDAAKRIRWPEPDFLPPTSFGGAIRQANVRASMRRSGRPRKSRRSETRRGSPRCRRWGPAIAAIKLPAAQDNRVAERRPAK